MVKVKCLHEKPVNIPVQGGRIDFNPNEEKDVSEEIANKLRGRKGFEVEETKKKFIKKKEKLEKE